MGGFDFNTADILVIDIILMDFARRTSSSPFALSLHFGNGKDLGLSLAVPDLSNNVNVDSCWLPNGSALMRPCSRCECGTVEPGRNLSGDHRLHLLVGEELHHHLRCHLRLGLVLELCGPASQ